MRGSKVFKKYNFDRDSDLFEKGVPFDHLPVPRWSRWQDNRIGGALLVVVCLYDYRPGRIRPMPFMLEVLNVHEERTQELTLDEFQQLMQKRLVTRIEPVITGSDTLDTEFNPTPDGK